MNEMQSHTGLNGLKVYNAGGYSGTSGSVEETKLYQPPEHMLMPHTKKQQPPTEAAYVPTDNEPDADAALDAAIDNDLRKRNVRRTKKTT